MYILCTSSLQIQISSTTAERADAVSTRRAGGEDNNNIVFVVYYRRRRRNVFVRMRARVIIIIYYAAATFSSSAALILRHDHICYSNIIVYELVSVISKTGLEMSKNKGNTYWSSSYTHTTFLDYLLLLQVHIII